MVAAEHVKAVLVEDEAESSELKLGPLLIAGLVVYIAVRLIAPLFVSDPVDFSDEEWIGMPGAEVLYYFGEPHDVEKDSSGAAVLRYRKIILEEEHYVVEDMTIHVTVDGRVTDFKRE